MHYSLHYKDYIIRIGSTGATINFDCSSYMRVAINVITKDNKKIVKDNGKYYKHSRCPNVIERS